MKKESSRLKFNVVLIATIVLILEIFSMAVMKLDLITLGFFTSLVGLILAIIGCFILRKWEKTCKEEAIKNDKGTVQNVKA